MTSVSTFYSTCVCVLSAACWKGCFTSAHIYVLQLFTVAQKLFKNITQSFANEWLFIDPKSCDMSWNSIYKNEETTTCSVSPIWKEIFLDFPCPSDGGLHGLHQRPGRHLQKSAKRLREHGNTMWFLWLFFFSFFKFRYAVKSKLSTTLSRAKCPNCIRLLVRDSLVLKGWWFTADPSWFPSACVGCCIYTTRGQRRGSQTPAWFEPRYGGSQLNVGLREQGFSKSSTKGTFNYESHLWIVFEHVFQSNVKITFSKKD